MGHMFDVSMSAGTVIIPLIMLVVWLIFLGLSLYVMILIIKALKIYINKNS